MRHVSLLRLSAVPPLRTRPHESSFPALTLLSARRFSRSASRSSGEETIAPEIYSAHNSMQRQFAAQAWADFEDEMSRGKSNIREVEIKSAIDFGCGAGDVTRDLREKIAQLNVKITGENRYPTRIVGLDISPAAVDFCNATDNPPGVVTRTSALPVTASPVTDNETGLEFFVADIGQPLASNLGLEDQFDLVTSYNVVHWVEDQNQILENVKFCLKKRGIFVFLLSAEIGDEFLTAIKVMKDKWGDLPQQFLRRIVPGVASLNPWGRPDPAQGYRGLVEATGLQVVRVEKKEYFVQIEHEGILEGMITSLKPSISAIPEDMKDEYIADFIAGIKQHKRIHIEGSDKKLFSQKALLVFGRKP